MTTDPARKFALLTRLMIAAERHSPQIAALLGCLWEMRYRCRTIEQQVMLTRDSLHRVDLYRRLLRAVADMPPSRAAIFGMHWMRWLYYQRSW
jgi:hypothetical protein